MSYSAPRNVNAHRHREDGLWSSSSRNAQTGSGIGAKIDGYFDKRELPMYKDKPYNYSSSRRKPMYQRWRFTLGILLFLVALLYWLGLFSSTETKSKVKSAGKSTWSWMSKQPGAKVDWEDRREKVKDAFVRSWDGYEKYAWGRSSNFC